ncbi:hypothetical protein GTP38_24370 [Duganella sp. FT94W]|uniref:Uncharacterized protein n=1 Tax=Duganella lactea TaxID=2692173 RepID=A0ABW9VFK3_9BURK|nr:hypothetical protein [Duganella lactea]MYM37465.1 hypothetical protein [Duganella lactea]
MNESDEIEAALRWFFEICDNPLELAERIEAARSYYRDQTDFADGRWASRDPFEGFDDRMAIILAQAVGDLRDIRTRDLYLAAEALPFLKMIGAHLDLLRRIPGATERARRMLRRREPHPDSGIFELVVALRYARENELLVEFIPEQNRRMADFLIRLADDDPLEEAFKEIHVECKRLRPSEYEKAEEQKAQEILNGINSFVHENKISLCVDVTFTAELKEVPADYLLRRLDAITNSKVLVPGSYPWKDEFGEGVFKAADIAAVERDVADTFLIVGSKLARLLAGGERLEEHFHLICGGTPHSGDPRFIDQIEYGTVVFWRCLAEESVDARARYIRTKLADIDRQVEHAPLAIAHIGMDVERDTKTADLRRERNLVTASSYHPDSQLMEVDLHYFLPRTSEVTGWIIDETVEPCSRNHGPFLENPRVLDGTEENVIRNQPAWRQRVPR